MVHKSLVCFRVACMTKFWQAARSARVCDTEV